jgi:signal transduction histidine kinase/PAS domain-containing protein
MHRIPSLQGATTRLLAPLRDAWAAMGITARLWSIVAGGLLVLIAAFGYLGISTANESIQQTLRERIDLVQMVAGHLDTWLGEVEQKMTLLAQEQGAAQTSLAGRSNWLNSAFGQLQPYGPRLWLVDKAGRVVATAGQPSEPPLVPLPPTDSIITTLKTGEFNLSSPRRAPNGQGAVVLASAPIPSPASGPQGALVLALEIGGAQLEAIWEPMASRTAGYMEVVSKDGTILLSTRPQRVLEQSDHQGALGELIEHGVALSGTCHECHQSAGTPKPLPEVMAFAPLARAPWAVVLRQDQAEAFASARRLRERILLFGSAAALASLALAWAVSRQIIGPIKGLTTAAQRIAHGDLDSPIDIHGSPELDTLARSFDEMRVQLRQMMEEIRAGNRLLDQRVRERTREYRRAQAEAQRARDHLQSIIDGLDDELVVVDRNFTVQQANSVVRSRWQHPESIIGQACHLVNHQGQPCRPPHCECPVAQVFASGRSARLTHIHPDPDGGLRYVEIMASPIMNPQGEIQQVVELIRDVTEERQMAQALIRRNQALSTLNDISTALSQSLDLQQLPGLALEHVLRLEPVDAAAIFLPPELAQDAEQLALRGLSPADALKLLAKVRCSSSNRFLPRIVQLNGPLPAGAAPAGRWVHLPLLAKGAILGSLCVGTAQADPFSEEDLDLLSAVAQQIAMAVENARLYADLQRKERRRAFLLKQVISAQEEERKRIARDLHDETVQRLTAIIMNCAALEQASASELGALKERLAELRSTAAIAIQNVRRLIFDLRPEALDDLGLELAVRGHIKERLADAGVKSRVEICALPPLAPEVEITVFRVIQEAISNIARHARASEAHICMTRVDGYLQILVQDDGRGFQVERALRLERQSGWGLQGMAERVALLNGNFQIVSRPGEGTRINIEIPLEDKR